MIPSSPSIPLATTMSTLSSYTLRSGVTISSIIVLNSDSSYIQAYALAGLKVFGFFDCFVNSTYKHKCCFWQIIMFTFQYLFKATDGLCDRHIRTRYTRKGFCYVKWLR